ncbi:hypothetical protein KM043_018011 [Ampulex compressa]|nr:hypothetical protein KM043_018011 [Ampulex compressa]
MKLGQEERLDEAGDRRAEGGGGEEGAREIESDREKNGPWLNSRGKRGTTAGPLRPVDPGRGTKAEDAGRSLEKTSGKTEKHLGVFLADATERTCDVADGSRAVEACRAPWNDGEKGRSGPRRRRRKSTAVITTLRRDIPGALRPTVRAIRPRDNEDNRAPPAAIVGVTKISPLLLHVFRRGSTGIIVFLKKTTAQRRPQLWSPSNFFPLWTADGALPGGKYVFDCDWHEIEMAGGREPGKYVIRIIVDPLSLPDTCAAERYGADTGVPFTSPPASLFLPPPEELFKRIST